MTESDGGQQQLEHADDASVSHLANVANAENAAPPVRFVAADERARASRALEQQRVLVVRIETIGASARGRLADVIDDAIERELDARGAAPPGIGSTSDADAALADQLFRARRVGTSGIALSLGALRASTSPRGALEAEDSATLRFWAEATHERPVWLLLEAEDAHTGGYGDPVPLAELVLRDELTAPMGMPIAAMLEAKGAATRAAEGEETIAIAEGATEAQASVEVPVAAQSSPEPVAVAEARDVPIAETTREVTVAVAVTTTTHEPAAVTRAAPPATTPAQTSARSVHSATESASQTAGASVASESDAWRHWTLSLTAARGPQPLAAFERLFAVDYMPLANAISSGLDDPRAIHACDEFRRTFSRSYTEACPTFAVTGKRPKMVLDAPDVAARIARLHGARTTQLLLVDAMRFDLGAMVKDELVRTFGSRASLTDETLLWSALPTTSGRQLETLSRGIDALRSSGTESEREADPLRGRTAEMIRRIKIGSRDVYKLDLVEARLREQTTHALDALPEIAEGVADAISRHAMTLQARTLLFVFGDHGFTLDREGAPHAGGASPEEVLVPAFAFLVGEVH